jgi:hypothetical protein
MGYPAERYAFPWYIPRKILTFHGLSGELFLIFMKISAKSKQSLKIFPGVHQGPVWCYFMKKPWTQISHATVPLRV